VRKVAQRAGSCKHQSSGACCVPTSCPVSLRHAISYRPLPPESRQQLVKTAGYLRRSGAGWIINLRVGQASLHASTA
jgi:hypothetical protein